MLYNAIADADAEDLDEEERRKKFAQFDDYFFRYCDGELKKINIFFSGKYARKWCKLATNFCVVRHEENSGVFDLLNAAESCLCQN